MSQRSLIVVHGNADRLPDVAAYIEERTGDLRSEPAYYAGFYEGEAIVGAVVFYDPEGDTIAVGYAFEPGFITIGRYLWLRHLVLWTAFVGLGYDHIRAVVRDANTISILVAEAAGMKRGKEFMIRDEACHEYRLPG